MSDPLKPIGNTAASLTAPAQTPVSKGSVISTLANTILSNYGKALLLVGAVCLITFLVTYRKSSGLQNLEPSPALSKKEDQDEARKIIREAARHEAVFALLEAKNPGFIAQVAKNLTSSNMDDVRGCRALLEGPDYKTNPISAFKLGENPWILPTVNSEENNRVFIKDESGKGYFIPSNIQTNRTILTQLGFTDEDILSEKYSLKLIIQENRVIEVLIRDEKEQLSRPIAIKLIKAPKMLPVICNEYNEEQTRFTQILINTLWLNSACENHTAEVMYKIRLEDSLFIKNDFKSVLEELEKLCPNICPPFSLTFGENSFKTDAEASIDSFKTLLTSEYVENLDRPLYAQFRMDKIIPLLYQKVLKITGPDGACIYPKKYKHSEIYNLLRTVLKLQRNDLPKEETIREIYIDTNEVRFTWIENSELKSSTHQIVDRTIPITWKNDEANETE